MKSMLIKTALMLAGVLVLSSCEKWPFNGPKREALVWKFINTTDQDLYFNFDPADERKVMSTGKLNPLMRYHIGKGDDPDFYILYKMLVDKPFYVYLDETSDPVRVWKRSEKDEPGKQFFNESSWILRKDQREIADYFWIFEIAPEDLE